MALPKKETNDDKHYWVCFKCLKKLEQSDFFLQRRNGDRSDRKGKVGFSKVEMRR